MPSLSSLPGLFLPRPHWQVYKTGKVLLADSSFDGLGYQYGRFRSGTNTNAQILRDSSRQFSGGASIKLLSTPVASENIEVKLHVKPFPFTRLGFECKLLTDNQFASTNLDFGIELRDGVSFFQARVRLNTGTLKWQFENGIDTYLDFNPTITMVTLPTPAEPLQSSGDLWVPVKLIADFSTKQYISFAAADDVRAINAPVVNRGASATEEHLFFLLALPGSSGSITRFWTTDWIITVED